MGTLLLLSCLELAAGEAPLRAVLVTSGESPEADARLRTVVLAQLADLAVDLQAQSVSVRPVDVAEQVKTAQQVARQHDAPMVFWVDLAQGTVLILVAGPKEDRIFVRHVESEGESVLGRAAAAAFVVRAAVLSTMTEARAGASGDLEADPGASAASPPSAEGPATAGEPQAASSATTSVVDPPAATTKRPQRFEVGLGYRLSSRAPQQPVVHSADLDLSVALGPWVWAVAGYRYEPPRRFDAKGVSATVASHPVELLVGARAPVGRLSLGAEAGVVLDYVSWHLTADPGAYRQIDERGRTVWLATGSLAARLELTPRLRAFVSAGLDVALNDKALVVDELSGRVVLVRPWRARPGMYAGLALSL